jgi:hypothetical protein
MSTPSKSRRGDQRGKSETPVVRITELQAIAHAIVGHGDCVARVADAIDHLADAADRIAVAIDKSRFGGDLPDATIMGLKAVAESIDGLGSYVNDAAHEIASSNGAVADAIEEFAPSPTPPAVDDGRASIEEDFGSDPLGLPAREPWEA